MTIAIRPATAEDREWLFELHEAAMLESVERNHGPWQRDEQRERFFARDETEVRIVLVDDVPVGAVHLADGVDDALHIGLLEVHPTSQGRGIATKVIEALDEEAARAGRDLTLRVRRDNPARRLYERLGFRVTGEDEVRLQMRRS